jgi:hypothetical protein
VVVSRYADPRYGLALLDRARVEAPPCVSRRVKAALIYLAGDSPNGLMAA